MMKRVCMRGYVLGKPERAEGQTFTPQVSPRGLYQPGHKLVHMQLYFECHQPYFLGYQTPKVSVPYLISNFYIKL